MTFLDELAASGALGSWAEPILNQLRARRERARVILARQAELLRQLEASLGAAASPQPWLLEFQEQQSQWQQRQEHYFQQQLATLEALAEQIADLAETIPQSGAAATQTQPKKSTAAPVTTSNWEQAKQRLLAQLESSTNEAEEKTEPSKPVVKSRRDWQQVIAEKDAEISRLRIQLEQTAQLAPVALPAAVELDEIIQIERANLLRLQEEWQEKLRRAEIEISLERAKLARERAQVEEKIQSTQPNPNAPSGSGAPEDPNKAPRSRWMARLGLLDE